jgi:cell division protein FtsW (lipid II flippase)
MSNRARFLGKSVAIYAATILLAILAGFPYQTIGIGAVVVLALILVGAALLAARRRHTP